MSNGICTVCVGFKENIINKDSEPQHFICGDCQSGFDGECASGSLEYCEMCDTEIDLHEVEGMYITTPAVLYGDNPAPEYTDFTCAPCYEKKMSLHESMEDAECDHYEAKRRGEI